jgi:hypothetical protein
MLSSSAEPGGGQGRCTCDIGGRCTDRNDVAEEKLAIDRLAFRVIVEVVGLCVCSTWRPRERVSTHLALECSKRELALREQLTHMRHYG